MKNCKRCRYSKVCNDLPGICIVAQYVVTALVVIGLIYLFISQELLS